MRHIYLAGPMSGHPQFNFPLFDAVATHLRFLGFRVQSPAELDDPTTRTAALASPDGADGSGTTSGETWGDFLARDVKLIADGVDGIAVMPGWWTSRGARLEAFVANLCGKPIYDVAGLISNWGETALAAGATQLTPTQIDVGCTGLQPPGCHLPFDVFKDRFDPDWVKRAAALDGDPRLVTA